MTDVLNATLVAAPAPCPAGSAYPARTQDAIKADCQRHFAAGGSSVQVFSPDGQRVASPRLSPAAALRAAAPGEQVFARRKVHGRYEWVFVGRGYH